MPAARKLVVPVLTVAALLGSASLFTARGVAVAADAEEGIQWRTDVEAATAEAARTGKPLFLDFTATWCPPCKQMERDTWTDPRVRAVLAERFTPVKVDVDDDPKTARTHEVASIPTLLVLVDGQPTGRVSGYHGPDQMLAFLEEHAPDAAEADAAVPAG